MTDPLYAGFDLGTTFFKVGLYDAGGRCVGLSRRAFEKDVDAVGHCTVPVARFRDTLAGALHQALKQADARAADITGVSYASQANTFLLLARNDVPLTPLIVWSDRRAAPLREELGATCATDAYLERSGQGIVGPLNMFAKLDWLRRHSPDAWRGTSRILTISDYLCLLMTGACIGDSGTASLTGLVDVRRHAWNDEFLERLELDPGMLPELHRPGSFTAATGRQCAGWLGIPEGTPFTVGALDHHVAALGGAIGAVAPVSVSFGTSLVCFRFEDRYIPMRNACIGPATEPDRYYHLAFNAPGASAMDGYRDLRAPELAFDALLELAAPIAPGCDGLRAEIEDGDVVFRNRHPGHGRGHHVRALMEMTGRNTAALLRDLAGGNGAKLPPVLAVGGAARSALWMEVVSATAGVDVIPAHPADTASKGAAMFAAVAAGQYKDLAACGRSWCEVGERVGGRD